MAKVDISQSCPIQHALRVLPRNVGRELLPDPSARTHAKSVDERANAGIDHVLRNQPSDDADRRGLFNEVRRLHHQRRLAIRRHIVQQNVSAFAVAALHRRHAIDLVISLDCVVTAQALALSIVVTRAIIRRRRNDTVEAVRLHT